MKNKISDEMKDAIKRYEFSHEPIDSIAKRLGLSREGFYYRLRKIGYTFRRQNKPSA